MKQFKLLINNKVLVLVLRRTLQVTLTWDETDHDRVSALNRKFNKDELLDMDFKAYLASSSEEEEEEEQDAEVAGGEED